MTAVLPQPAAVTRFRIAADPDLVGPLRDNFSAALSAGNLSEAQIRGWLLTFNELVFNAIRHGASGIPNAEVVVPGDLNLFVVPATVVNVFAELTLANSVSSSPPSL